MLSAFTHNRRVGRQPAGLVWAMLYKIRKNIKSVFFRLILVAVALTFISWGAGYFSRSDQAADSKVIAKVEGIPGGISTGANLAAAISVAERPEMAGKTIVTFAPSCAERYFSSDLFVDPDAKPAA